jgi:hypothetical protein
MKHLTILSVLALCVPIMAHQPQQKPLLRIARKRATETAPPARCPRWDCERYRDFSPTKSVSGHFHSGKDVRVLPSTLNPNLM